MVKTIENKRGLSAIVATLIIILLVLVAVGIIWVVVRNVIQGGSEQVELNTKCLAVDLKAVSVVAIDAEGNYTVSLKRNAGGEELGGIKVNIFNSTDNSGVIDFSAIPQLETQTETVSSGIPGVLNASKLEFTAYFLDDSGNELLCQQTSSYTF